jgi:hypothetical protein
MSEIVHTDGDEAAREQDIALGQARQEVLIEIVALAALVSFLAAVDYPRGLIGATGLLVTGVATTRNDIKWWMWLRRASPQEAARRLQDDALPGQAARHSWPLRLAIAVVLVWWWVTR